MSEGGGGEGKLAVDSDELFRLLSDAARELHTGKDDSEKDERVQSLLADLHITRERVHKRHLISDRDIERFRNAEKGKLSPWPETAIGAAIATTPPFLIALISAFKVGGEYAMTIHDFVSFGAFIAVLPLAIALPLLNRRGTSVEDICTEIENRPIYEAQKNGSNATS